MKVSAVIPTRGDVDMQFIVQHLQSYAAVDDIWIVVGSTPFNRYLAAAAARHDVIYTQDDDCITDIAPLLEAYVPGIIVNAMTPEHAAQYPRRQTLIGFGAIFDRALIKVLDGWERDPLFYRESDRIFATLNPHKSLFPGIRILPYASAANRMWKQPDHLAARDAINAAIFQKTGIRA